MRTFFIGMKKKAMKPLGGHIQWATIVKNRPTQSKFHFLPRSPLLGTIRQILFFAFFSSPRPPIDILSPPLETAILGGNKQNKKGEKKKYNSQGH